MKEEMEKVAVPVEDAIILKPVEEEEKAKEIKPGTFDINSWKPKTELGRNVKSGKIKDISVILESGADILESEIVDALLPDLETDLLLIGQSKGKFGGGQRRVFRQTQKKTKEGNKPHFATIVVAGNNDGFVGIGYGKAKETVPAREKALRNAKLNMIQIRRGCGSWGCDCGGSHSIPFKTTGRCGSIRLTLMPAPKGTGLCVEDECKKILKLAGIKDIWSRTKGQTGTKLNLIYACVDALKNLVQTKTSAKQLESAKIYEGRAKHESEK